MYCRFCNSKINNSFLDLGHAPPSNSYLCKESLSKSESFLPLKVGVCTNCWLVQTEDFINEEELFTKDYAYLSSVSQTWLNHCESFVKKIVEELNLSSKSFVLEVAANDGYLLQYFKNKNIPCIGVEPTEYAANIAKKKGLKILNEFFTLKNATKFKKRFRKVDLVIGNNVYAHVPDIKDFTLALKEIINKNGVISLEFPHLMKLIEKKQFDTIYHEHFSYLSFTSVNNIFNDLGLRIFNVEELKTHGGSLRIYGCLKESSHIEQNSVNKIIKKENKFGITNIDTYKKFQEEANLIKNNLIELLIKLKKMNKTVMAYGAAAKGNTLLNYAGIKKDLVSYVFDKATSKQNKYLPGSHIKILNPKEIYEKKPDYLLILPWNISNEIITSLNKLKKGGTKFIIAVPEIKIIE